MIMSLEIKKQGCPVRSTQSCLKMDPNWEEEKRPAKIQLANNSDERAGGVSSNMA